MVQTRSQRILRESEYEKTVNLVDNSKRGRLSVSRNSRFPCWASLDDSRTVLIPTKPESIHTALDALKPFGIDMTNYYYMYVDGGIQLFGKLPSAAAAEEVCEAFPSGLKLGNIETQVLRIPKSLQFFAALRSGDYERIHRARASIKTLVKEAGIQVFWDGPQDGNFVYLNDSSRDEIMSCTAIPGAAREAILFEREHSPFVHWEKVRQRVRALQGIDISSIREAGVRLTAPSAFYKLRHRGDPVNVRYRRKRAGGNRGFSPPKREIDPRLRSWNQVHLIEDGTIADPRQAIMDDSEDEGEIGDEGFGFCNYESVMPNYGNGSHSGFGCLAEGQMLADTRELIPPVTKMFED